jgi:hypothetical protein
MMTCGRFALISAILASGVLSAGHDSVLAQYQPVIRPGMCSFVYQPVCAKSRKRVLITYGNLCDAKAARSAVVSDGACPDNCPQIYKPVCARDANGQRKTYMNSCAAKNEKADITRNSRCLIPSRQS